MNCDWLIDERWLDWLDSKVALLIDRKVVDPREYGGKNYDEYVIHEDELNVSRSRAY
jgi:hypothetical protein